MPCNLEELRAAHAKVAKLVIVDPVYVPVFERLELMIAEAESKGDVLARARAIAARQSAMA
ncbi:hypothetical protein [Frigidibacter sp.]|uniref:hypothetical protein n=1 Tax=Frigidibacter sp. TaxID=2586418 RepID=UPI0027323F78|nr:hypothetical protein [Frigidibacter sp.]MDP3341502.1 hypothetical protein [Frigidibacter sp.]